MSATLISSRHKVSPVLQRGFEISIRVNVIWGGGGGMNNLREKIMELNYPIDEDDVDASREILAEILSGEYRKGHEDEEDDGEQEETGDQFISMMSSRYNII